jgi:hypothetical protein
MATAAGIPDGMDRRRTCYTSPFGYFSSCRFFGFDTAYDQHLQYVRHCIILVGVLVV